ncbi:MAG: HIRAN domain-containing protein [Candidatus Thiodiazotropha sp.]
MLRRNVLQTLLTGVGIGLSRQVYAKIVPIQSRRRVLLQESPLAGFQYHRAAAIWPFLRVGEPLRLRREPGNPHDRYAIAVWFRNEHLGYIPRRENRTLAKLMDQGERLEAQIVRLLEENNPWRKIRLRVELVSN